MALNMVRDKPAGTIRISARPRSQHHPVARLSRLLPEYPEIKIEITISYGLIDIVAERYDAGVRRQSGSQGHDRRPYRA